MKIGFRKPSLKKSIKARTTGRVKRAVKKATIPGYGKKGMGFVNNPKKAVYNKIYNKTTIGVSDCTKAMTQANQSITQSKRELFSLPILLCTIFGGWFGLHKYVRGHIGTGLLYTFTCGLFFIGWGIDILIESTLPRK